MRQCEIISNVQGEQFVEHFSISEKNRGFWKLGLPKNLSKKPKKMENGKCVATEFSARM
jgi:hypothetical protein